MAVFRESVAQVVISPQVNTAWLVEGGFQPIGGGFGHVESVMEAIEIVPEEQHLIRWKLSDPVHR